MGGGVNEGRKTPLEEIGNSISYSSSIRNMLICKLKEKEQVKENRIVLKPRVSKEAKPMQNSIVDNSAEVKAKEKEEAREREVRQEKEAAKREVHEEKPYRRDTIRQDKLQSSLTSSLKDTECTVSKKAPKPIQRDEMQCSVRLFDDSIPMYLKSSQLEDNIFTNRRPPRLETEDQDDSAKFGQFYKRIRNIIDGDCC